MAEKMKAIIVKPTRALYVKEFSSINGILREIGINPKHEWETMELNNGKFETGIIAHDQDKQNLKSNRLGINGAFAIIGMKYIREGDQIKGTVFSGLTDEQEVEMRSSLIRTTYHDLMNNMGESELDD